MRIFRTASYCSAIAVAVFWLAPFASVAAADEPDGAKPAPGVWDTIQADVTERAERRKARAANADGRIAARRAERGMAAVLPLGSRGPRVLWWNLPQIVEELGLSDEMRGQFDAYFEASKVNEVLQAELVAVKRSYVDALKKGDWSAAEKQLAAWVELETRPIDSAGKLKLKVLARLSDQQLQKLAAYSSVTQVKWVPRSRWVAPAPVKREP